MARIESNEAGKVGTRTHLETHAARLLTRVSDDDEWMSSTVALLLWYLNGFGAGHSLSQILQERTDHRWLTTL